MHSNTGFEKNTRNKNKDEKEPKVKVKTKRVKTKRDILREIHGTDNTVKG